MNRILWIVCFVGFVSVQGQEDYKTWKKLSDDHAFERGKDYTGPTNYKQREEESEDNITNNGDQTSNGDNSSDKNIDYSPERNEPGNSDSDQREIKDNGYKPSTYDAPERKPNNMDFGMSAGFGKTLLILVVIILVGIIAFYIYQNKGKNTRINTVIVPDDITPESISKTELELRLEAAEAREDYRECVRIYFIFILKELIAKGWIKWNIDKTNSDYKREMAEQKSWSVFNRIVYLFDAIWYGEKQINMEIYAQVKPEFVKYYAQLVERK
jgi:hypothetical protein